MKIGYLQKNEATAVWIGRNPGMVGVARRRPDDRWNPVVGLAVALLKAEFGGPTGQDRDAIMIEPNKDDITEIELSDAQVLVWADLRHGMRLALRSVEDRREQRNQEVNGFAVKQWIPLATPIPSDGQLCENFALRFISETDLQID